ncbi:hypothetical protein BJ878DRAFT_507308 [Calycina marina]|uniref:JmjC domain-containing protein n=1 Tax=Calycina marina TaxID=1763456 RepID=A0A9P7Z2Q4_9HELO|nr:hypothetical protein BJ878DRAFT_507308 [Calycina marina]
MSPRSTKQATQLEQGVDSRPQDALIDVCLHLLCQPDRYSVDGETTHRRSSLEACGLPIFRLLCQVHDGLQNQHGSYKLLLKRCNDLIAIANEKFYAYPFKDVPRCWMNLYIEASLLKFSMLATQRLWMPSSGNDPIRPLSEDVMDELVSTLDMALIMTGPPSDSATGDGINMAFETLRKCHMEIEQHDEGHTSKKRKLNTTGGTRIYDQFPESTSFEPKCLFTIPRVQSISFTQFERHMLQPQSADLGPEPLIIRGAIGSWPARNERAWSNPSYLLSKTIGGRRLVPIETGRSYVDEGWGQKITTFKEFMHKYILLNPPPSSLASGYLAQHNLFAQIPSLRLDIAIPDYCYTRPPPPHHSSTLVAQYAQLPQLEDPLLNAWFGPAGTISPLHTDPYHNFLAQVVGKKYVRLYAPRESEKLYARGLEDGGIDMGNTSALDVGVLAGYDGTLEEQNAAHEKFPLFESAKYVDCILEEGEGLYIPVGWWHYVRSLSVSFSVSFWFN